MKDRGRYWSVKINRVFKFRLYPNRNQQVILNKTFGCCRFLWNRMLHERTETYQRLKDNKDDLYSHKYKTEKEYKQQFPFLKEVDAKALQSSTSNLLVAFKNFFDKLKKQRKAGYPRFKPLKSKQSYTTYNINNNTKIDFTKKN